MAAVLVVAEPIKKTILSILFEIFAESRGHCNYGDKPIPVEILDNLMDGFITYVYLCVYVLLHM